MEKKQILGTHYSLREDGVVWDDKHNKERKTNNGSVSISFSIRKLMNTYFPQKVVAPQIEGVQHKMIDGHESYQIYSKGQVYSRKLMKFITSTKDAYGHWTVQLDGEGKQVHRLIYEAFVGKIPEGFDVHHIDKDKDNQDPSNLLCLSHADHAWLHSLRPKDYWKEIKKFLDK